MGAKSQLDYYLEQIGESSSQQISNNNSLMTEIEKPSKSISQVWLCVRFVFVVIINGILKDFCVLLDFFRSSSGGYITFHQNVRVLITHYTVYDASRIFLITYWFICVFYHRSIGYLLRFPSTNQFLWRIPDSFIIFLALCPVLFAVTLAYIFNLTERKFKVSNNSFTCLLSVVKRIQLVSLGRSLSHPLPPLTTMENGLIDQHGDDRLFVCKDVRMAMKTLLLELIRSVDCVCQNSSELQTYQSSYLEKSAAVNSVKEHALKRLNHYKATLRAAIVNGVVDIPTSAYLQEMALLALVQTPDMCIHNIEVLIENRVAHLMEVTSRLADQTCTTTWSGVVCHSCELLLLLLECPLLAVRLLCAVDRCQRQLNAAAAGLRIESSTEQSISSSHVDPSFSHVDTNIFSSAYLSARVRLARLRVKYEEASHRMWLCEQALSSQSAKQCLLPDGKFSELLVSTERDIICHNLRDALAGLHSVIRDDMRLIDPSSGQFDTASLTSALEHFYASLPLLADWQDLDQQLRALVIGSETGAIPTDQIIDRVGDDLRPSDHEGSEQCVFVTSVMSYRNSLLNETNGDVLEHTTGSDVNSKQPDIIGSCGGGDDVVEVFTATVPKQIVVVARRRHVGTDEEMIIQRRLRTDQEREALQAKSLLVELSVALGRKDSCNRTERVRTIVNKTCTTSPVTDEEDTPFVNVQPIEMVVIQESSLQDNNTCNDSTSISKLDCETLSTSTPLMFNSNVFAMAELRGLLASSIRPGGGKETCYSCSDDEEVKNDCVV